MAANHSTMRNTCFHNATNLSIVLEGFLRNGSITEVNILFILSFLLVMDGKSILIQGKIMKYIVTNKNETLLIGNYDNHCDNMYSDLTELKQVSPDCACLVENLITNMVRSYQSYRRGLDASPGLRLLEHSR